MLRYRTALMIVLFVAIGDALSKTKATYYSPKLLIVIAILACWYIFSTSVNDLADEEIDKINLLGNAERPLVNKQTNRSFLWRLSTATALLCILLSFSLGVWAIATTIAALILSYIYSMPPLRVSYRGILATLLLPIGYVLFPVALAVFIHGPRLQHNDFLIVAALYISFAGRIILKDFRDVKGDTKFGKRTFIVRHGARATCLVSGVAWGIGGLLMAWRFHYWLLFIIALAPVLLCIFYYLKQLAAETKLDRQIKLVGLIGRLGNGAALLVLTALYRDLEPTKHTTYNLLLISLAIFNLYAAYVLYSPLLNKKITVR